MENTTIVNNTQTAQLRNVISLLTGVERAENRPPHLPGLVCFYGPAAGANLMPPPMSPTQKTPITSS